MSSLGHSEGGGGGGIKIVGMVKLSGRINIVMLKSVR